MGGVDSRCVLDRDSGDDRHHSTDDRHHAQIIAKYFQHWFRSWSCGRLVGRRALSGGKELPPRLLRRADLEIRKWLKQLRKDVRRNRTRATPAGLSVRSALRANAATPRQTTAKRAAIRTSAITFPVTFGSVNPGFGMPTTGDVKLVRTFRPLLLFGRGILSRLGLRNDSDIYFIAKTLSQSRA
jgi:hypothetical protein